MEKICVAVRVRPPLTGESLETEFWKVEANRISLQKNPGTPIYDPSYSFDHIFDQNCSNARLYELLIKDIVRATVEGFNGTAFAYGQTSSGKTYTMNGSESDPGIIPLAVKDVFQNTREISSREFLIRVSYMEIYNEEINDLLASENCKLEIHESLERGVFVAGLQEEIVDSVDQVLKLLETGEVRRHFGQTNMNANSSRSHTIFRMVIESRSKELDSSDAFNTDAVRVSALNLVDLAGSERIAKTGAGGVRLREGKHINKSLMILGNVINKLSDSGKQRGHIPYRDSKLTRMLQSALGGNAKTSIICTISPEEDHIEETKGTLQFASRAKRVTNCARVNEVLTDEALLKRQKLEIEELRRKLQGSHSSILEQEILKLRNDMLKYELEREKLAMELEEERNLHKQRDQHMKEQEMKIVNLNNLIVSSDNDRSFAQGTVSFRQSRTQDCSDIHHLSQEDSFGTPCFKTLPHAFVAKRSNNRSLIDSSPIPDNFNNTADEDMWLRLNRGQTTDLNALQMSIEKGFQSSSQNDISSGCQVDNLKEQVENLKKQLQCTMEERNKQEKNYKEQLLLNNQLKEEMSELERIRDIPQKMCSTLSKYQEIFKDVLSNKQHQRSKINETSVSAKLLSSTFDIGLHLFACLDLHFSKIICGDSCGVDNLEIRDDLAKKINSAISTLVNAQLETSTNEYLKERQLSNHYKDLIMEVNNTKERIISLEREYNLKNQLLRVGNLRCESLEKECSIAREERATFMNLFSTSSQNITRLTAEKDELTKNLDMEIQRRKNLEEKSGSLAWLLSETETIYGLP